MGEISTSPQVTLSHSDIPPEFIALDNDLRFIKVRRGQKVPSEVDWQGSRNYSSNDPDLNRWISNGGNYGYFLRDDTDLCVLDADRPEELVDLIEYLGDTLTVKSGRAGIGYHILFRCADLGSQKIYLKNTDGKDIGDIRPGSTEKKYQTVGPGSIHPDTGNPYQIVNHSRPIEVDRDELLKLIQENYTAPKKPVRNPGKVSVSRSIKTTPGRHEQCVGGRNDYLFHHACRLRRFNGYNFDEIYNEIGIINQTDCKPPLDINEVETISRSATRYPAGEREKVKEIPGSAILRKIAFKKLMKTLRRNQ